MLNGVTKFLRAIWLNIAFKDPHLQSKFLAKRKFKKFSNSAFKLFCATIACMNLLSNLKSTWFWELTLSWTLPSTQLSPILKIWFRLTKHKSTPLKLCLDHQRDHILQGSQLSFLQESTNSHKSCLLSNLKAKKLTGQELEEFTAMIQLLKKSQAKRCHVSNDLLNTNWLCKMNRLLRPSRKPKRMLQPLKRKSDLFILNFFY